MKRSDMLLKLQEAMVEAPENIDEAAEYILSHLEKLGMKPPHVGNEKGQLLISFYVYPNYYQWDEDLDKDERLAQYVKERNERMARINALDRELIEDALKESGGDTYKAARLLNVPESTLHRRCRKFGIELKTNGGES